MANDIDKRNLIIDYKGYTTKQTLENLFEKNKSADIILVRHLFHPYRSLYIARLLNLKATGNPAQLTNDVSIKYYVKEYFANLKVILYKIKKPNFNSRPYLNFIF